MSAKRDLRFFNTTDSCNPYDHYMFPPEDRLVGAQLHRYIRDQLYLTLHAPRHTDKLLREFQKFWRRHADLWEEKADDTEVFFHLLLQAFLQRVLNGRGRIERECAAGLTVLRC